MGCEAMKLLPIIDFSDLKQETPAWESVKSQVRQAFEEYGCFEATLDDQNIPLHLRKSLFDGFQQLFDLPLENKRRNRSDKPYQGYTGKNASIPLYESLGINDALSPGNIETFTNLMWSDGNPTFSNSVQSMSEKLSKMDQMVRRMVVESLGLEKYLNQHLDSTNYVIRVQKYDAPPTNETNKVGLVTHTDKNIVTILYQNEVNGLQVMTKDGDWITTQPSPNSFIVMVGQSFHAWTNGRLHPPFHRVMMSGEDEAARYSIGLFSIPLSGRVIKAPEEMVDEEHPLLFKPFDYAEFIQFYYSNVRLASAEPLKAYCGAT